MRKNEYNSIDEFIYEYCKGKEFSSMQTEFGGSENTGRVAPLQTEGWLSDTGQVAQSALDYSHGHFMG